MSASKSIARPFAFSGSNLNGIASFVEAQKLAYLHKLQYENVAIRTELERLTQKRDYFLGLLSKEGQIANAGRLAAYSYKAIRNWSKALITLFLV